MDQALSLTAYAKRRGCALRAVQEAIQNGRITAKKAGRRWVIEPERADREWQQNTDLDQQGRGNGNKRNGGDYFLEKTALARTQRLREERKLAEEEGRLVDKDEYDRAHEEHLVRAAAIVMSMSEELGPRIAAETDPRKVIDMLDAELRKVCALLAGRKAPQ
jgi:hypothetical protein